MNPPPSGPAYTLEVGDDRELIERMGAGDERALARFYDRWARAAYAVIVQMVRDPDDADDVLEDAFYQAWRQAARYEPGRGSVATWMLTIARSRALDCLRARRRLREEPLTPIVDGDAAARGGVVVDVAEVADQRERVAAAVRTLPAEQREVVELAYFKGLSQSEIAERTGQPLGTVKTRTRLAGEKLRERLSVLRDDGGAR